MEIGVENMNSDIKIRKVNQTDATKWFKFVNKVWRSAYKSIFPEEVFLEKEKNVKEKEKNFNQKICNDNKNIALVAEYKGEIPQTLEDWEIGAIQFFASFGTRGFPGGYANNKHNKNYYNERYRNFKKQIELLKQTGGVFINKSYMDIEVPDGSLIYCDPPYMGTKPYGYAFENDFNHSDYWNWVRNISKNNYVICSEEQCPEDFEIVWNGELTRLVHSDNNYKGNEILCIYDDGLLKSDMLK